MRSKSRPTIDIEEEEAKCMQSYTKALSQLSSNESNPDALYNARETFEDLLDTPFLKDEGYEKFSKAPKMFKHLIHKNLAHIYEKDGNYTDALDCAEKALAADNSDGVLCFQAGKLALKQKDYPLAGYYLKKCVEIIPSHWDALNTLLETLFVLGEFDECEKVADKCLSYYPDSNKALALKSYLLKECHLSPKDDQETSLQETVGMNKWLSKLKEIKEEYAASKVQAYEDSFMDQEETRTKKITPKNLSWCELACALIDKQKMPQPGDLVEFDIKKLSRTLSDGGLKKCDTEELKEDAEVLRKDDEKRRETRKVSNLKGPFELQKLLLDHGIITEELQIEAEFMLRKPVQNTTQSQSVSEDEESEVFDFIESENNKTLLEFSRSFLEKFFSGSKFNSWNENSIKPLIAIHKFISTHSCDAVERYYLTFAEFIVDRLKPKETEDVKKLPEMKKAEELLMQYRIAYGSEDDLAATIRIFWLRSRMASLHKDRSAEFSEMEKALFLLSHRRDSDPNYVPLEVALPHCTRALSVLNEENIKEYAKDKEAINGPSDTAMTDESKAKATIEKFAYVLTSKDRSDPQRMDKIKALLKAYKDIGDCVGCVGCYAEELSTCEPHRVNEFREVEKNLIEMKKSLSKVKEGMLEEHIQNTILCGIYNMFGNCAQDESKRLDFTEGQVVVLLFDVLIALINITKLKDTLGMKRRIEFFSELHKFLERKKLCDTAHDIHMRFIETLTEFPTPQNYDDPDEWDDWEKYAIEPKTGIPITEWTKMYSNCVLCMTGKVIYEQCTRKDKVRGIDEKKLKNPKFLSRLFFVTSFLIESPAMKKTFKDIEKNVLSVFAIKEFKYKSYVDSIKSYSDNTFDPEVVNETDKLLKEAEERAQNHFNSSDDRFEAFTRENMYTLYNNFLEGSRSEDMLRKALYVNPVNAGDWELLGDFYMEKLSDGLKERRVIENDPVSKEKLLSLHKKAAACFLHSVYNIKSKTNELSNLFSLALMRYWVGVSGSTLTDIKAAKDGFNGCPRSHPSAWESLIMAGKCEMKISRDIHSVLPIYRSALMMAYTLGQKDEGKFAVMKCNYYLHATRAKYILKGGDLGTLSKIENRVFTSNAEVLREALENGFIPLLKSNNSRHKALRMACEVLLHGPPEVRDVASAVNIFSTHIKMLQSSPFESLIRPDKWGFSKDLYMPWEFSSYLKKILLLYVEAFSIQGDVRKLRTLYDHSSVKEVPEVMNKIRAEIRGFVKKELALSQVANAGCAPMEIVLEDNEKLAKAKELLEYANIIGTEPSEENEEVLKQAYRNYSVVANGKEPEQEFGVSDILKFCKGLFPKKKSSSSLKPPKNKKSKLN